MKQKIGIQVDVELHAKVKSAAPLRGTNLEGAYEQALRAWLSGAEARFATTPNPKNQKWYAMLDEVLADPEERHGIEKNLQWAIDSIRGKGAARRVGGKSG